MSIPSRVFPRCDFRAPSDRRAAFTLVELLTVMGFMSLLVAVTVPAVNGLKGSGDLNRAVDEVSLTFNRARTHAMTQNTYVWVGILEESALSPSASVPPYTGQGTLVLGVAASADGTAIYDAGALAAAIPETRLKPLGRVLKVTNVHATDLGSPSGAGGAHQLDARPAGPYTDDDPEGCRISSDSGQQTPYPFAMGGYIFYKTVRFSPSGEVTINGSSVPKRLAEIGLVPAQGDRVSPNPANMAAIQISGIGGNVRVYRK